MKIIISPAKKMNVDTDAFIYEDFPKFLVHTEELKQWIKSLTFKQAQKLWACNDKITELNMAPGVFSKKE